MAFDSKVANSVNMTIFHPIMKIYMGLSLGIS